MADYKFPGMMKKVINKKELEDQRKRDDEVAAAKAFEEYIADFQDTQGGAKALNKTWVKAGVYEAGKKHEDSKDRGKLYKPTSRFETKDFVQAPPLQPIEDSRPERLGKKKEKEKKKSNLEIFKDELKLIQEEREERHRLKHVLGLHEVKLPPKPGDALRASLSLELDDVRMGSIDDGDPNTTNIYLGNLPTKVTEQGLMELFGKFGPLASVKVMWPRTDEEKARNRLSGFVAYMSRRDGERALKHLVGKEILGTEVKLGWGKAVPIPAFPIYIPPQMLEMSMPPPLSGLPFNAQPHKSVKHKVPQPGNPYPTDPKGLQEFQKVLDASLVKVVPPTERGLLALIHRMVEFVAREGPMFEAMVMNREINNALYRFLFENQSPAHVYYRWKLFSVLQGEPVQRWRTEEFRMFKGGSIWRPPTLNPFTQGLPEELIPEDERDIRKGTLSNAQRDRFERMLRRIRPERYRIAEVMIFCIEHSESVDEICQLLKESLGNPKTPLPKKISRLYIISDILRNSGAKGMNAVVYRKFIKNILPGVFQELHYAHQIAIAEAGSGGDSFKERVMACFRAWEDWEIFSKDFLIRLQNIFLGLITLNSREDEEEVLAGAEDNEVNELKSKRRSPPRATMPPKSALNLVRVMQSLEPGLRDIDGVPLDESLDGVPMDEEEFISQPPSIADQKPKGSFMPSKWETVDPEEVLAQAVTTTSKWDLFEDNQATQPEEGVLAGMDSYVDEDLDGVPMEDEAEEDRGGKVGVEIFEDEFSEDRRLKLREIENKVLAFQDDLESGRRKASSGETIARQVQHYRDKLLKKSEKERGRGKGRDRDEDEEGERSRGRRGDYESDRRGSTQRSEKDHRSDRDSRQIREPRSERESSRYENSREPRSERDSGRSEQRDSRADRESGRLEREPRSDHRESSRYEREPRSERESGGRYDRSDRDYQQHRYDDGESSKTKRGEEDSRSWKRRLTPDSAEDEKGGSRSSDRSRGNGKHGQRSGSPSPKRSHHSQSSRNGSPSRKARSRSPRKSRSPTSRRSARHRERH